MKVQIDFFGWVYSLSFCSIFGLQLDDCFDFLVDETQWGWQQ
jgi:hypothetical protein